MARRASKVDDNQREIVQALRKAGASVQFLHDVGMGCPDILVGYRGVNHLMEIKDGDKSPSRRRLTPFQDEWHAAWSGQVAIVSSVDEALAVIVNVVLPE